MLALRSAVATLVVGFVVSPALAQSASYLLLSSPNNVPTGLSTAPAGAVPYLGNAAFGLSVDNPTGLCPITNGSPAAVVFAGFNSPPLALPGYGCIPGQPGDVLFAPASYISTEIAGVWTGPGSAVLPMPIPAAIALCGGTITTQGVFVDLVGPNGVSLTEGLYLRLGVDPNAVPPFNDECFNAPVITNGVTNGTNAGATTSPITPSCGPMGDEVWYQYIATCDGSATFSLCPTGGGRATYDTVLAVFRPSTMMPASAAPEGLPSNCDLIEIACNDDTCGLQSEVTVPVTHGQLYYVAVGGFSGARGCFSLSVSCAPSYLPPNDACQAAIPIPDGLWPGSNVNATTGPITPSCATFNGQAGNEVWYQYLAPLSGTVTVSLCPADGGSADFDTVIAAYDPSGSANYSAELGGPPVIGCDNLVEIACNDDACGLQSYITFPCSAGWVYYIAVAGWNGATGNFTLSVIAQ